MHVRDRLPACPRIVARPPPHATTICQIFYCRSVQIFCSANRRQLPAAREPESIAVRPRHMLGCRHTPPVCVALRRKPLSNRPPTEAMGADSLQPDGTQRVPPQRSVAQHVHLHAATTRTGVSNRHRLSASERARKSGEGTQVPRTCSFSERSGRRGYRSLYLSHAKRALYDLS